jgi:hypothetical protein
LASTSGRPPQSAPPFEFDRFEQLKPDPDHTDEVIARMSDLTIARAMFDLAIVQYPGKLIMLCQKARILRRSDRPS